MGYGYLEPDGTGTGGAPPPAATETVAGIAEIATQVETDAGTADNLIVSPLKLATRIASLFSRAHDRLHNLYSSADHADVDASTALANGQVLVWDATAAKWKPGLPAPAGASVTAPKMAADNKGVIICTSTTRPLSPVEGQHIYETDTDATLKNTGTPTAPLWAALGGGSANAASTNATFDPVRVATTVALPAYTHAAGVLTASVNAAFPAQDSATLALNQRLMVKNETGVNGPFNGLYTVTDLGSGTTPWKLTRASDADTDAEFIPGKLVSVSEGTMHGNQIWAFDNTATPTLGTTAITFAQAGGVGQIVRVDRTIAQSLTIQGWNVISWNSEVSDASGWFDPATPTQVTIGAPGDFLVSIDSFFASNATGIRTCRIKRNGNVEGEAPITAASVDSFGRSARVLLVFAALGDVITAEAFQNSGVALDFGGGAAGFPIPSLRIKRLL